MDWRGKTASKGLRGVQQSPHLAASLSQTVLHGLVVHAELPCDVGHLHAAVEMEAVDLGTGLRQTVEAALDVGHGIAEVDGGQRVVGHGREAVLLLIETLLLAATEVVYQQATGHGVDQTGQGGLDDDATVVGEQAQEELLHHVLGGHGVAAETAAHKGEQLVAVVAVVAFYDVAVIH